MQCGHWEELKQMYVLIFYLSRVHLNIIAIASTRSLCTLFDTYASVGSMKLLPPGNGVAWVMLSVMFVHHPDHGGRGSHVTITHDALYSTVQALPLLLVTSGGQHWRPVQNCSLQRPPTQWYWHLVATEACTVGKLVIRILLECFLEVVARAEFFSIMYYTIEY